MGHRLRKGIHKGMDDKERVSPSEYGYDEQYEYMHICPTCFHLYEMGRPDTEEQRCNCQPAEETRWPYHDFNQRAILCRCCALNVLPSGSRWSPYFCRECRLLVMGVSVWNRQLIFPIGRHSLMHTWVPDTPSASLHNHQSHPDDVVAGVYHALGGISRGAEGLSQWYQTIVPRNLKRFGLAGDVSLRAYIEAVTAEAPALSTRLEAFDGLCRLFQSDPLETAERNSRNESEYSS